MAEDNLPVTASANDQAITDKLQSQSPLHGAMGRVYQRLGGEEALMDWAEENYGEFLKIMIKLAPPPQEKPGGGNTGSVTINLPEGLGPSALDGMVVAEQ